MARECGGLLGAGIDVSASTSSSRLPCFDACCFSLVEHIMKGMQFVRPTTSIDGQAQLEMVWVWLLVKQPGCNVRDIMIS